MAEAPEADPAGSEAGVGSHDAPDEAPAARDARWLDNPQVRHVGGFALSPPSPPHHSRSDPGPATAAGETDQGCWEAVLWYRPGLLGNCFVVSAGALPVPVSEGYIGPQSPDSLRLVP